MFEESRIAHVDLFFFQHGRHRHHQRKLLHISLEVIGHRDHGFVVVPRNGDLGDRIEQVRVGLAHVKAAKSRSIASPGEQTQGQEQ
jgi:hypothetical protein